MINDALTNNTGWLGEWQAPRDPRTPWGSLQRFPDPERVNFLGLQGKPGGPDYFWL